MISASALNLNMAQSMDMTTVITTSTTTTVNTSAIFWRWVTTLPLRDGSTVTRSESPNPAPPENSFRIPHPTTTGHGTGER